MAIRLCYCCAAVGPFCQKFPWRSVHSLHTTCGKSCGTWVRDHNGDISPNTCQNTSWQFTVALSKSTRTFSIFAPWVSLEVLKRDMISIIFLKLIWFFDFVFFFFPLQGHSMTLATTMLCWRFTCRMSSSFPPLTSWPRWKQLTSSPTE